MSGKIIPKKQAKGVDFCGVGKDFYIVRSDLGCYMKSSNFHLGTDVEVLSLHHSCRGGDHYMAINDGQFYIIKENAYRRVKNMTTDENSVVYSLHPKCQGGDHYLSAFNAFYIIYQSRGVYRRTTNLHEDLNSAEYSLHTDCKNGLYYFGTADHYYFVKPHDNWGIQFLRSTDFHLNKNCETFSFHTSIINFLPGGFSVTKGPAHGEWVCIKTISNDSQTPVEWTKRITKRIGFEKEKMSGIEHNWNVSGTVSAESGGLIGCIAKVQFSATAEYGGCSVSTETENWNEAHETEENIGVKLLPNHKIYIWSYQLCLGKEPVLHCRDMRVLDNPNPPTDVPLPAT